MPRHCLYPITCREIKYIYCSIFLAYCNPSKVRTHCIVRGIKRGNTEVGCENLAAAVRGDIPNFHDSLGVISVINGCQACTVAIKSQIPTRTPFGLYGKLE